jgi:hypothetical protein
MRESLNPWFAEGWVDQSRMLPKEGVLATLFWRVREIQHTAFPTTASGWPPAFTGD